MITDIVAKTKSRSESKVKSKKKIKDPCGICEKRVAKNQKSIQCNTCGFWIHKSCEGMTDAEYQRLDEEDDDIPWSCIICLIKLNAEIFPFGLLSKLELLDLYGVDLPSHLKTLPSFETRSKLINLPNLEDFDIDENVVNAVNSKYYNIHELNKIKMINKNFSVFHTNIRSLSKHIDALHTQLNMVNIPFDVLGISETKQQVDKDFLSNVQINGYSLYTQPSKSACGGCALYVNSQLDHHVRNDLSALEEEYETLWVEINNHKAKNFLCCCLYRHPSSDLSSFINYLTSTLQKVQKENKVLFIMGDYNINLFNYDSHTETNDFLNLMISHYLLPHILHPTRVTDHSATIIDNIFSNNCEMDTVSGNLLSQISDHFPQFLIINNITVNYRTSSLFQHDYSKFNESSFINDFNELTWNEMDDENIDINHKFNSFYEKVNATVVQHVPLKKVNHKQLKLRSKPWVNLHIQKLIKHRDRLLRKLRKSHSKATEELYKKFRNRVVSENRKSKIKYYESYFQSNKSNIKSLWKGIKSIINTKARNTTQSISQLVVNGITHQDPQKMANVFNNFFVNVSALVCSEIPRSKKSPIDYLGCRNPNSIYLNPIIHTEIDDIISLLQNGKSTGPFSIPVKLLKVLKPYISQPLANIFNQSIILGIFPDKLKYAKVIPIHKKGSPTDPSNYRPISLLSIFSKIFEKLMHKRLYEFLDKMNIFYSLQFGFREKHSTNHALISMTESIRNTIDNGKFGCGVFIDLKKAFDTVNHDILLKKLEHYGVRGIALDWFASYLSNRKQYVSVNGHISDYLNITCGVPQGSVLGPLLFLIYINDLPNISKLLSFYLFADDTNIYFEAPDMFTLQKIMNRELRYVKKWLDANKLALNIEKTNFVVFHSTAKKVHEPVVLKFGRKKISRVKYVKFLGVLLDETLSWKYHLIELSRKLSRTVGVMYKLRHFAPLDTLKSVYYALFYPFLTYGITVWGATHEKFLHPVSVCQKKAVRAMTFNDPLAHTSPIFSELQLLKLEDIHCLHISSFVYECHNKLAPIHFRDYFTQMSESHSYNTRGAARGDFFLVRKNTLQYGLRSICFNGAKIWNTIPSDIRNSPSIRNFKNKLKKRFLQSYGD